MKTATTTAVNCTECGGDSDLWALSKDGLCCGPYKECVECLDPVNIDPTDDRCKCIGCGEPVCEPCRWKNILGEIVCEGCRQ